MGHRKQREIKEGNRHITGLRRQILECREMKWLEFVMQSSTDKQPRERARGICEGSSGVSGWKQHRGTPLSSAKKKCWGITAR